MATKLVTQPIPHSWSIDEWPSFVYPHRASKARYTIRCHRDELVAAGALTRVGRDLVVLGAGYSAWLSKQGARVDGFQIAPNSESAKTAEQQRSAA